jgi:hypothetical protein
MLLHALLLIMAIIKQSERRSIDRGTKRALTNLKQYDTKDHETRRAPSAPSFLQRRVFLAPKAALTKVK